MKKRHYYITILTICSIVVLLGGCGKKNTKSNHSYNNHTNQTAPSLPTQPITTAPENAPKVSLSNLTVMAGSEIDYMSAIESVENMELSKSMVYINSSNVDRFTPGSYTVYYNFDYMGYTVKSFITVTILENTEQETVSSSETVTESTTSENSPSEQNSTSAENSDTKAPSEQGSNAIPPSSEQTGETTSSTTSNVLDATIYDKDVPIPDAVFTLSTGETVTIKNTPTRYIVETFTDDSYYTEDGYNFLCSELKILLNTGEVQTIETVISRVTSIPE